MKEKRKPEENESIHESDKDKESCRQNEKARSEEQVETTENDKSEENTQNMTKEMNTDSPAKQESNSSEKCNKTDEENDKQNKKREPENIFKKLDFWEIIGQEATWTAIAAIGAGALFIWNAIRYAFLLTSSIILKFNTNVPIYLLMMRKNVNYSDAYLFYLTVIVILSLLNPMQFIFKKKRNGLYVVSWLIIGFSIFYMIIMSYNYDMIYRVYDETFFFISYILPVCLLLLSIKVVDDDSQSSTAANDSNNTMRFLNKIKIRFTGFGRVICFILVCCIIVILMNLQPYALLDQNNRFIVADLGEQYIVQEAKYDRSKFMLFIDNTRYYVIDSNNESVECIKIFELVKNSK